MIKRLSQNINYLIQKHKFTAHQLSQESGTNLDALRALIYEGKEPPLRDFISLSQYFQISTDRLLNQNIFLLKDIKIEKIKLIVLDIDGVMTDGKMTYSENGDELKSFNTKDGMGIIKAVEQNYTFAIISSGFKNEIIQKRATLLGIKHVYVGREPKQNILETWMKDNSWQYENIAYIGDDVNDLYIMKQVALSACPCDAVQSVKNISTIHLQQKGGEGCVREFLELWLNIQEL